MADEETKQNADAAEAKDKGKQDGKKKKDAGGGKKDLMVFVGMCLAVVILSTGGGVAANMYLGGDSAPEPPPEDAPPEVADAGPAGSGSPVSKSPEAIQDDFEYFAFDALTVNLNVPRVNRYLNCKVLLAVSPDDQAEAFGLIEKKKVVLKNWLMAYLGDLKLEDVSGRKNITRIQREIRESLNDQLWPDQRQRIHHVLFDDFFVK